MQTISCNVTSIEMLTEQVYKFILTPSSTVNFEAGQYLQLVLAEDDKRAFSIANSPDKPYLELHIGATDANPYAMAAVKHLQDNSSVTVEVGLGKAQYQANSVNPIILVAGGTGFSYVKSIAEHIAQQKIKRPVFLYWGAKQADALYASKEMQAWANQHTDYQFVPVVEEPSSDWTGKTGYVHQAVMQDIISLEPYDVYVAGPFNMVGIVREDFINQGALIENMHADAFAFI